MRVRRDHWRDQVPLICFVRLSVLWRERAHLATIQPRFWPRLLLILATSLAIAPLNGLQQLLYGRRIRATAVHPRPIFVLALYRRLMGSYLRERQHIPAGQLVEIAYAELDTDPLTTLERLYAALDLGPFEPQRQRVATYVDQQSGHRRNRLQLSAADRELVSAHWAFAVEAFGYGRAALAGAGHAR
jgi:hypothetical protein